jgi:type I restriction enzyme S subunit
VQEERRLCTCPERHPEEGEKIELQNGRREVKIQGIAAVDSGQGAPQGDKWYKGDKVFVKAVDLNFLDDGKYVGEHSQRIGNEAIVQYKLRKYPRNSIVFPKSGMSVKTGHIALLKYDSYVVNHLAIVQVNSNNEDLAKYLYYLLKTMKISKLSLNDSYPSIRLGDIKKLKIVLPPFPKLKNIVTLLEKVEQLKQWRQDSNKLTISYLNSTFLEMFGDKLPKNNIGDIAEFVSSGSTPLGGEATYLSEGIIFIRSQNVHMNELRLKDVAHISEDVHKQMRRTWVKNGDVLLNITGASLGRVAVYEGENDRANVNQHVCIIRVNTKLALPQYISHYLSMLNAQKEIWTIQAGASRQALNFKRVKDLKIYLPEMEEQKKFVSFVNNINQIRKKQAESSEEINNLFESLFCRVFKGEAVC